MICEFKYKGEPLYILASSIVAVLPDTYRKGHAMLYTEPPLGELSVDETVDEAFAQWYYVIMNDEEE